MTTPNTAAIESLRTFALNHGEFAFVHLCTAALGDERNPPEAWAVERVRDALNGINDAIGAESSMWQWMPRKQYKAAQGHMHAIAARQAIRTTDTTRPDGLIARSLTSI